MSSSVQVEHRKVRLRGDGIGYIFRAELVEGYMW